MHQTKQRYGGASIRGEQYYASTPLLGNDVGSGTDGTRLSQPSAVPRALQYVQVLSTAGTGQIGSQILLRGAASQSQVESEGLQVRHHSGLLQAGQIRRVRPDHEVRSGESAQAGRQREKVAAKVALEQDAVLRAVSDQTEEQDHLPAATPDRIAKDGEDVHREEAASAAHSRHHEDQESAEATDANGGDRGSIEKSGEIDPGHEEARRRPRDGHTQDQRQSEDRADGDRRSLHVSGESGEQADGLPARYGEAAEGRRGTGETEEDPTGARARGESQGGRGTQKEGRRRKQKEEARYGGQKEDRGRAEEEAGGRGSEDGGCSTGSLEFFE